jgi:hypothetical protein
MPVVVIHGLQSSSSSTTVRRSPWTARGRRSTRSCASKPCRRKRATRHVSQSRKNLSQRLRYIPAHFHAAWCSVPACIHVHVEPTARALVAGSSTASPRGGVAGCHRYTHHTGLPVQGAAHVAGRDPRGLLRGGQRTDRGADPRSTHAPTQHHNTQHPPAQHTQHDRRVCAC